MIDSIDDKENRFYKIEALVNEFRGAQCRDFETLDKLLDVRSMLHKITGVKENWILPDFHSIGPPTPESSLFSVYGTPTLAYHGSVPMPEPFGAKMAGISETLDAFLEGEPILILHFLVSEEVLDLEFSIKMNGGDLIHKPFFQRQARAAAWCFRVNSLWSGLYTQGTGSGSFIDFYLKNRMTGLEFVPQRFSDNDPNLRMDDRQ